MAKEVAREGEVVGDEQEQQELGCLGAGLLGAGVLLVGAIVVHLTMGDNEDEVRACVDAITTLMSDADDAEDSEDLQN